MSLETRATALLLVAVRENVPEPIESVMTALKAESNRADSSINMAVHGAKRCLIALREIEITRGVKATRDVKATPDVLTMCASSDEEKQAAKTAWDVKIAAKIVKRKAAQKLNREKPSVLLATANRKLEKRKASQLEFGKDEEGNYNTPQDKNRRQKREANQLEFGKDEEGNSNIPADKKKRKLREANERKFGYDVNGMSLTPENDTARKLCEANAAKFGKDIHGKSLAPKNKKARKKHKADLDAGKVSSRELALQAARKIQADLIWASLEAQYGSFSFSAAV